MLKNIRKTRSSSFLAIRNAGHFRRRLSFLVRVTEFSGRPSGTYTYERRTRTPRFGRRSVIFYEETNVRTIQLKRRGF